MDKIIIAERGNIINWTNVFEIDIYQPPYAESEQHRRLNAWAPSAHSDPEVGMISVTLYEGHEKNAEEVKEYLLGKLIDKKCVLIDLRECINQLRNLEWKAPPPPKSKEKDNSIPF